MSIALKRPDSQGLSLSLDGESGRMLLGWDGQPLLIVRDVIHISSGWIPITWPPDSKALIALKYAQVQLLGLDGPGRWAAAGV